MSSGRRVRGLCVECRVYEGPVLGFGVRMGAVRCWVRAHSSARVCLSMGCVGVLRECVWYAG